MVPTQKELLHLNVQGGANIDIYENEFLKDELYNRAYNDIERQEIEIDTLKDKCVDLMLENADHVWDEIARETAKKRANTRKWRARKCI